MPSASVKSDSTGSSETQDPLGKLYLLVEKKIRNLEKRKNKLENYKAELVEGKELNEDQQRAVDAYDAVIASLELCKEFGGQIDGVIAENVKIAKLQQKKQQEEKSGHELERIKQVLKVQDVLRRITEPAIRADFAAGTNGAIGLKTDKLKQLDALQKLVTPPSGAEREKTSAGFKGQLNTAAENLLSLVDGKNKPAAQGTTYRDMKTLVYQIANCPYPKVPQSAQVSNASSPVPESESQTQSQKNKKNKPSKAKAQISNGTPASEVTAPKQSSKNTSRVTSAPASNSSKPTTQTLPPPPSVGVAPVVINSSSLPSQVIASSPSKILSQNTVTNSAPSGKSKRRETHSTEGPPPGIAQPTVQGAQANNANLISAIPPQIRSGLGTSSNSTLSHPNAYFNATQVQASSQPSSRVSLDINDLVTSGNFNFLQESQVVGSESSQAAVYVDPAVVSFCSMKPEKLVQIEQQHLKQLTAQSVPPVLSNASSVDVPSHQHAPQHSHIPSETFINQAFVTSSGPAGYSQVLPTYSSTGGVAEAVPNTLPPAPIPLPKEEKKTFVEPSNSWAAQEDTDGWGAPDPPVNTTVNGGESNSWGIMDGSESNTWGDPSDVKHMQDGEEKRSGGGFRGMNRGRGGGSRGGPNGGGYRGRATYNNYQGGGRGNSFGGGNEYSSRGGNEYSSRGGNEYSSRGGNEYSSRGGNEYSSRGGNEYSSSRGGNEYSSRGGNGYTSRGGRGGPSSNGGGYRGRGNFSRGGRGNEGSSRGGLRRGGGGGGNGGFQSNPPMQRNQY